MVRTGLAVVSSLVLLIVESIIVMKIKGHTSIYYGNTQLLISVLAMNFFFAFAILTQLKFWIENRTEAESEIENIK